MNQFYRSLRNLEIRRNVTFISLTLTLPVIGCNKMNNTKITVIQNDSGKEVQGMQVLIPENERIIVAST